MCPDDSDGVESGVHWSVFVLWIEGSIVASNGDVVRWNKNNPHHGG